MIIALGFYWVFAIVWLIAALWIFQYNWLWSLVLLAATVCFGGFLSLMTHKTVADGYKDYVLEINEQEAVLMVSDRLGNCQSTQMVLLDDVKYAEYYPYSDSSLIILHAPYVDMEVPLWPMAAHAQDVIDYLQGRNVNVVNVLSQDKIPD